MQKRRLVQTPNRVEQKDILMMPRSTLVDENLVDHGNKGSDSHTSCGKHDGTTRIVSKHEISTRCQRFNHVSNSQIVQQLRNNSISLHGQTQTRIVGAIAHRVCSCVTIDANLFSMRRIGKTKPYHHYTGKNAPATWLGTPPLSLGSNTRDKTDPDWFSGSQLLRTKGRYAFFVFAASKDFSAAFQSPVRDKIDDGSKRDHQISFFFFQRVLSLPPP
jgi:hypothetical protein